ncbi:divergent polysaccharide deacetylase family protein [Aquamicrobium segne]|uniref:Divergent polysaccharide deacetylase family protein n=1 Tax=Aquamicrobium segne TaxID=469547 RepID=A0ABW0H1W5_9HYPH
MSDKKEIDRPLGQGLGQGQKPLHRAEPRVPVAMGAIIGGLVVVALLGASTMIALRERPWRQPEVIATPQSLPEATTNAASSPQISAQPAQPGGPQIIRVQQEEHGEDGPIIIRDPSALHQDLRIAHLPDRALIEETDAGPLPKRAADGRRPFDVYARPWSGTRGARVAIVIGGLAVSQTGTQAAIAQLPPEVTLAFASGGNSIGRWMQEGRRKGHEIIMQMPMEPFDYPAIDPGRNTLTVEASQTENLQALHRVLSRTTNYVGVMNYMGARFSADSQALGPIMHELAVRGLGYLDDGSSARSRAPELAAQEHMPLAVADTQIDAVQDRDAILKKLDELEATARAKGSAIGIGSAFGMTVDAVATWVEEAKMRGIEIVPISALANDPEKR